MEKQEKSDLPLSLKDIALRRVAAHLYSDSDVPASLSERRQLHFYSCNENGEVRREIFAKVEEKVLKLGLPKSLTKQLADIGTLIFLQIKRWRDRLDYHLNIKLQELNLSYSEILCWTPGGLIDHPKTAERLVCCDALDAVQRYKIACFNCLENCIKRLWEKLPKEKKDYFYNQVIHKKRFATSLHFCWPYILKGELSELDSVWNNPDSNLTSFNQWAFINSTLNGSQASTEYFFRKLAPEEKEASLTKAAKEVLWNIDWRIEMRNGDSDVWCHLVSLMNPEQQRETIKADPIYSLKCILHCSYQDLFLENATLFWSSISPHIYIEVLQIMLDAFEDYCFPKLFQEFFVQSPPDFKKLFVHSYYYCNKFAFRFLSIFVDFGDSENIKVMFGNLSADDRLRTMIQDDVIYLFYQRILQDKWHMVEVCLQEGLLSEKDRKIFKNAFMKFLRYKLTIDVADPKWKRLFEFLGETNGDINLQKKAQKRKLDD